MRTSPFFFLSIFKCNARDLVLFANMAFCPTSDLMGVIGSNGRPRWFQRVQVEPPFLRVVPRQAGRQAGGGLRYRAGSPESMCYTFEQSPQLLNSGLRHPPPCALRPPVLRHPGDNGAVLQLPLCLFVARALCWGGARRYYWACIWFSLPSFSPTGRSDYDDWKPALASLLQPIPFPKEWVFTRLASRSPCHVSWVCCFVCFLFYFAILCRLKLGRLFHLQTRGDWHALSPLGRQSANCLWWATVSTVPAGIIVVKRCEPRWTSAKKSQFSPATSVIRHNAITNAIRRDLLWLVAAAVYTRMSHKTRKWRDTAEQSAQVRFIVTSATCIWNHWGSRWKHTQYKRCKSVQNS